MEEGERGIQANDLQSFLSQGIYKHADGHRTPRYIPKVSVSLTAGHALVTSSQVKISNSVSTDYWNIIDTTPHQSADNAFNKTKNTQINTFAGLTNKQLST